MTIEQDLHSERVTHLDLSGYTQVEAGTSIHETIKMMRRDGNNCAFVTKNNRLIGIFTDRDVMREVVDRPDIWDHPIEEVMTHNPRSVKADQLAGDALKLMNSLHFRNAPVLNDQGTIVGNLTHFAVIHYLADLFPEEVYNLPPEPDRYGEDRHGG